MHHKHNPALTDYARELRKHMTKAEKKLWYDFLKDYPIRFLRQKVIDNYIADFYCRQASLVIELDGSQHYEKSAVLYDQFRTEWIENYQIQVIRIPNCAVLNQFQSICDFIDQIVRERSRNPSTASRSPSLSQGRLGAPAPDEIVNKLQ